VWHAMNDKLTKLEEAKLKLKSRRSILDMIRDNTDPATLKKLEVEWCQPIVERIKELEAEA
jgi:hypothetical protein